MSFSDRSSADPVEERASEQDPMPAFSTPQPSLQHSDPVAMPTMERILACGVNHWYADVL